MSFLLLFILLLNTTFQEVKLIKTKINNNITISIPEGFTTLNEGELNRKYLSTKPPLAIYSDYSRTVDLGINVAYSQWNAEDLQIMKSFYKSNIMGLYDEVRFISEGMEKIDGKEFVTFEFVSTVREQDSSLETQPAIGRYTRIHYTIVNYKTLLVQFSCPVSQQQKWASTSRQIMESVKIGKSL